MILFSRRITQIILGYKQKSFLKKNCLSLDNLFISQEKFRWYPEPILSGLIFNIIKSDEDILRTSKKAFNIKRLRKQRETAFPNLNFRFMSIKRMIVGRCKIQALKFGRSN